MTVLAPAALDRYQESAAERPALGHVILWGLHDLTLDQPYVARLLDRLGLEAYTPKATAPPDTYRKACSSVVRKREPVPGTDTYVNLMVRPVSEDKREILQRLVIETVDHKGKVLTYSEVADLIFDRAAQVVRSKLLPDLYGLPAHVADHARATVDGILRTYRLTLGHVDDTAIRRVVARVLDANHAVSVRQNGGGHFVPRSEKADVALHALRELAKAIRQVDLYVIPLPDTDEQRDMVRQETDRSCTSEIDRTLTELRQLLAGEKVSKRTAITLANKYRSIVATAEAAEQVLEHNLDSLRSRLVVLEQSVTQALGRAS